MKRAILLTLLVFVLPGQADEGPARENLTRWTSYFPVQSSDQGKIAKLILQPNVFAQAKPDLSDLRLINDKGNPVPYVLRVREARNVRDNIQARTFDRVTLPDGSERLSLDLGEGRQEHNEIRLDLSAISYGRALTLESSEDGKAWGRLLDGKEVVLLEVGGQRIDQRRFLYPPSRVRYLRVTLKPDVLRKEDAKVLQGADVNFSVQLEGENLEGEASLEWRDPVRTNADPASSYLLDLGAAQVPVSRLILDIEQSGFDRPFLLETYANNVRGQQVQTGYLRKKPDSKGSTELLFPEIRTRHLLLTIIDSRNLPLKLNRVRFSAPARVLFFPTAPGLRLYAGNDQASSPNYDFAQTLQEEPASPEAASTGQRVANPDYVPPPAQVEVIPWTERNPWILDLVMVVALAILGWILLRLGREAIADQAAKPAPG